MFCIALGTEQNFGKKYEDDLRVVFDQWPKLNLGLHVQLDQKIFNCIYSVCLHYSENTLYYEGLLHSSIRA